nr:WG repeat-containing protein [Clostridia bacterium]
MKKLLFTLLAMILILCLPWAMAEEKPAYEYIGQYGVEGAVVVKRDGLYGLLDAKGQEVFPCQWRGINYSYHNLLPVSYNGVTWGVIDMEGNTVLPFQWETVRILEDGSYEVQRGGLWGLLDAQGQQVIPCEYRSIRSLGEGMYEVGVSTSEGLLHALFRGGEQATDFCLYYVDSYYHHDRVVVYDAQGRIHVLNGQGEVVFSLEAYTAALSEDVPLILAHNPDGSAQFYDLDGNPVGERWDSAGFFYNGLARVERSGKFGFIGTDGQLAIPLVYDNAWDFSEGLALVGQGEEIYWIDTQGNRGADWHYAGGREYVRGVALVMDDAGLYGLIDRTGALITTCQWQNIRENPMFYAPFTRGSYAWAVSQEGASLIALDGSIVTGDRYFDWLEDTLVLQGDYAFVLEEATGEVTIWNMDGQVW